MKKLLALASLLLLTACATVTKVDTGTNTVGERMSISLDSSWNHLDFPGIKPAQVWTMEGVTVDEFLIYAGIREGQAMHPENPSGSKQKDFVFHSSMQAEDIVALFEGVLTRDNSVFKLRKLEPYRFAGKNGFRFEFERIRKIDNVQLRGVGFGAVDGGELFALLYQAPRLAFFPRYQAQVEAIARSASLR
ncbi:MAG: hypothetical protein PHY45_05980 [Rhodocyclaceae bacterium]|nr:hypothetical protein [Rhodocyclaceae bacterium]